MRLSTQKSNLIEEMDSRLREIYSYYLPQLASASHVTILAAYWDDTKRWPSFQWLIWQQQLLLMLLSRYRCVAHAFQRSGDEDERLSISHQKETRGA
jgi:hypothetical protein